MSEELKPCPFCGSPDLEILPEWSDDINPMRVIAYFVHCKDCLAQGRMTYPIGWCESELAAIQAWNDRVDPIHNPDDWENGYQACLEDQITLLVAQKKEN